MSSNRMSGNVLGLKIGSQYVACETSCEVNFETDLLPASPIDEGAWKSYISGVKSWNVSVNAAMLLKMSGTGFNTILSAFVNGTLMSIRIATKYDNIPEFAIIGNVRLRNGGFSAAVNTMASWNSTLEGDGAMSYVINIPDIYNTVFYGSTSFEPTTESQVEALSTTNIDADPLILNTSTYRYHTIAIPSDKTLTSVLNITAEEDVLSEYIPFNLMMIDGVEFRRYTMDTIVGYLSNNQHEFTIA